MCVMTFHSSALTSMFRHRTLFQIVFSICRDPTRLLHRCSLDANIISCVIPLRLIRPTDSYLLP